MQVPTQAGFGATQSVPTGAPPPQTAAKPWSTAPPAPSAAQQALQAGAVPTSVVGATKYYMYPPPQLMSQPGYTPGWTGTQQPTSAPANRSAIPSYQNVTLGATPSNPGTGVSNPFIQPMGWSTAAGFSYGNLATTSYATTSAQPQVPQAPVPAVTQVALGSTPVVPAGATTPMTSVPATTPAAASYQQVTAGQPVYWSQPQPPVYPSQSASRPSLPVTTPGAPAATPGVPATPLGGPVFTPVPGHFAGQVPPNYFQTVGKVTKPQNPEYAVEHQERNLDDPAVLLRQCLG